MEDMGYVVLIEYDMGYDIESMRGKHLYAIFLLVLLLPACARELPTYPIEVDFQLIDQNRKAFTSQDLQNKISLFFFGFTRCPSVCLHNSKRLEATYQLLSFRKNFIQMFMVSIDPEYDSPEIMGKYFQGYKAPLFGLWGPFEKIEKMSQKFGSLIAPSPKAEHFIEHSTYIFLLDKKAFVRHLFRREDLPQKMASTIRRL